MQTERPYIFAATVALRAIVLLALMLSDPPQDPAIGLLLLGPQVLSFAAWVLWFLPTYQRLAAGEAWWTRTEVAFLLHFVPGAHAVAPYIYQWRMAQGANAPAANLAIAVGMLVAVVHLLGVRGPLNDLLQFTDLLAYAAAAILIDRTESARD